MRTPTVPTLLAPLAEVDDRGVGSIDRGGQASFVSWRGHLQDGADLAALVDAAIISDR